MLTSWWDRQLPARQPFFVSAENDANPNHSELTPGAGYRHPPPIVSPKRLDNCITSRSPNFKTSFYIETVLHETLFFMFQVASVTGLALLNARLTSSSMLCSQGNHYYGVAVLAFTRRFSLHASFYLWPRSIEPVKLTIHRRCFGNITNR